MGTYYHGNSEIQGGGDGLQTLILMNPGYVGYSDTQPPQQSPAGNFVFLNSTNHGNVLNVAHAQSSQPHQFVGIPLTAAPSSHDAHSQHDISALQGFHLPRGGQYNFYNQNIDMAAAREVTRAQQGLSLTLSSQQPGFASFRNEREVPSQPMVTTISPTSGDDVRVSGGSSPSASGISNGVHGVQSVLLSSKYLRAAQELLDEVVNVGKGVKTGTESSNKNMGEEPAGAAASGDGQSGGESSGKRCAELTTAERQEIQMKKAKLVNMLDEVEQRYRQYHHQMQIVITWFEQAAGIGSAKTYTALALQTISKQFRCLKDAILGQIRAASKALGEEGASEGKIEGSRLKFVDNQIRQQRALQQLGMIQHNAWRPQRGLPERAVSVLRAWLFEHFLHPYPKDSDKIMLAKQTGLTRSQVSNWFINARVRLWKPMVEEMYLEEVKDQEQNGSEDKTCKSQGNEDSTSKSNNVLQEKPPKSENQNTTTAPSIQINAALASPTAINLRNQPAFELIGTSEMDRIAQASPKKPRGHEMLDPPGSVPPSINVDPKTAGLTNEGMSMKFGGDRQGRVGFSLMGGPADFIGGFGSYNMGEIERFGAEQFPATYSTNGVSLTLGLPHCENMSMSGAQQTFLANHQDMQLGRGLDIGDANDFDGLNTPTSAHSTNVYESINIQNRKRFAAQLLPDFVA